MLSNLAHSALQIRNMLQMILFVLCVFIVVLFHERAQVFIKSQKLGRSNWGPTIIVITPTHPRPARIADMTRFSQTLALVNNLHWIVVEDGNSTLPHVEDILRRSGVPYAYFSATTDYGIPRRGWTHRNRALAYIREHYANHRQGGVVYFGDDDNAYDFRLFDRYIRKVKRIGIWAVGLVGSSMVETPKVEGGKVVGWDVVYAPEREFATDMAGYAINLREVLKYNATFSRQCIMQVPETCYLHQYNISRDDLEPFGFNDNPKEVYVWHTKTRAQEKRDNSTEGYLLEGLKD